MRSLSIEQRLEDYRSIIKDDDYGAMLRDSNAQSSMQTGSKSK